MRIIAVKIKPIIATILIIPNQNSVSPKNFGFKVFNKVRKAPLLLLDDIGAETVTNWNRDEILGSLLQYRMQEGLPTFFTSNNTIKELEEHLIGSDSEGRVKSRRIIERIKYLTDEIIMVAENRRK